MLIVCPVVRYLFPVLPVRPELFVLATAIITYYGMCRRENVADRPVILLQLYNLRLRKVPFEIENIPYAQ